MGHATSRPPVTAATNARRSIIESPRRRMMARPYYAPSHTTEGARHIAGRTDSMRVGATGFGRLCVQVMALRSVKTDVTEKVAHEERLARTRQGYCRCCDVSKQVRIYGVSERRVGPRSYDLMYAIRRARDSGRTPRGATRRPSDSWQAGRCPACRETLSPSHPMSNRSRFITFVHAATKSPTNFFSELAAA